MENLPLINDYFVELKVLASTFTSEDRERYEKELEEYETQVESMERMGLDHKIDKPVFSTVEPDFKKMWVNLGAMIILNCTVS